MSHKNFVRWVRLDQGFRQFLHIDVPRAATASYKRALQEKYLKNGRVNFTI